MTDADDVISRLFREPSTPDRDEAFAATVRAEVARLRRRATLLLTLRLAAGLALLAVGAALMTRFGPVLPDLSKLYGGFEILSVPAPLVFIALLAGLAFQAFTELKRRGWIRG